MKNKLLLIFILMILILVGDLSAQKASRWGISSGEKIGKMQMIAELALFHPYFMLRHEKELNLSADQKGKLEKILYAHQEAMIKMQAEIKTEELKLSTLLKAEKINRKDVEKQILNIGKKRTDHQLSQINLLLDARDLLSAEQIKTLEEIRANKREEILHKFREKRKENR